MKYTWEQILKSPEFKHGQEFIKVEDVALILNTIFARLLPVSNFGQIKNITSDIKKIILDLNKREKGVSPLREIKISLLHHKGEAVMDFMPPTEAP